MFFKQKLKKIFASLAIFTSLMTVLAVPAAASGTYQKPSLPLDVKAAIAVDSSTGQLLYAKNANKKLPIASMTKLITVYLTLQAIKNKKISWQTKVTPTPAISKVANNKEYSNVPLSQHHQYTVRQLYQATLIESANGAAMCLAQAVAGSQKIFVQQMRRLVAQWQIKNAKIYTVCGLANGNVGAAAYPGVKKSAENELSARDMAVITMQLLKQYPQVLQTSHLAHLNFADQGKTTKMTNFNWMLKGLSQYSPRFPVDGLKTGTTDKAGACFVGTLPVKNSHLITVVMGARHQDGNDPSRFWQTKKLMSYLLDNYQPVALAKGEQLAGASQVKVTAGQSPTTSLALKNKTNIWDPRDGKALRVSLQNSAVAAPLNQGQTADYYRFSSKQQALTSIYNPQTGRYENGQLRVAAAAKNDVNKVNIFVRLWRWLLGEH